MAKKQKTLFFKQLNEVFKSYSKLSKEQRNLLTKHKIEAEKSPEEWLLLVEPLAQFDSKADILRPLIDKYVIRVLIFMAVGVVIFWVLSNLMEDFYDFFYQLGFYLVVLSFVAWLLLKLLKRFILRLDINNGFRTLIPQFLQILRNEIYDCSNVSLKLDISRQDRKKYHQKTDKNYTIIPRQITWFLFYTTISSFTLFYLSESFRIIYVPEDVILLGAVAGMATFIFFVIESLFFSSSPYIRSRIYQANWAEINAKLADGSFLNVELGDMLVHNKVTRKKTNFRGKVKIKTKHKYKIRTIYSVKVALPNGQYQEISANQFKGKGQKLKVKNKEKRNIFAFKGVDKRSGIESVPNFQKLVKLIMYAYQNVKPVEIH